MVNEPLAPAADLPPAADQPAPSPRPRPGTAGGGPGGRSGNRGNTQPKTGNRNALRHGGFSRLTLPSMPAKLRAVQRAVNDFRAALEVICREQFGRISVEQACHISTAALNERLCRLWGRRLAAGYETMDDAAVAAATDRVARHAAHRDAAVAKLGLTIDAASDPHAGFRAALAAAQSPPMPAAPPAAPAAALPWAVPASTPATPADEPEVAPAARDATAATPANDSPIPTE